MNPPTAISRRLGLALVLLAVLPAGCSGSSNGTPTADARRVLDSAPPEAGAPGQIEPVLNREYLPAFEAMLGRAQSSVRMVHLYIKEGSAADRVVAALTAAAARGVTVRVLLEDGVDTNAAMVAKLSGAGIQAKVDSSQVYTHAKLLVVDGKEVLVGSTNCSTSSTMYNNEANLHIAGDPALAAFFEAYAAGLWELPASRPSPPTASTATGSALRDGDYYERARTLFDGAQRRIWIVVYGINTDSSSKVKALVDRLAKAAARGVEVKVILEQADYSTSINALNQRAAKVLQAAGVTVRFDALATITHAKVTLVDDEAIVATNNWGEGGFGRYHEAGVQTRVPAVVTELASYFNTIWAAGSDPQ